VFFERHKGGECAILVHVDFSREDDREDPNEFHELVVSAGADPVAFVTGSRHQPDPKYFIGGGKVQEVEQLVTQHNANIVLFNHALSPSQERNLESIFKCRVLDRTGLILDIFAQRARTHEGKLQVELAQLQHMSTRLVRGWTHLERQKGGIGLRGPGETQLETDRRLLRARIKSIQKRLEKVRKQRDQGRRARSRAELPSVSLVGYTNAGKSTMFNAVTDASVYAADQLFATLDPTLRRVELPHLGPIVLADTVGFIRHLPHKLVNAFQATLEEAREADLLLHIIDAADDERLDNIEQVEHVLKEIDALKVPTLLIYNKIDLLERTPAQLERDKNGKPARVWCSAQTGAGLDLLKDAIVELLAGTVVEASLTITPAQGRLRAKLFELGVVQREHVLDNGDTEVNIRIPQSDLSRLVKQEGIQLN